ncbi:MAG: sugar ABC transporter ATP-binding protein [Solirubrobacterales bacterium]|nr:sugar ABC transporter ATP-binding protein [Solirubrobacterales bacterium]
MESVLEIHGLSKTFPGQKALDAVDFDLRPGEVHALIGQNGSGKSTLIKVLAGYHQPDPGATATVAGEPFTLGSAASAFAAGLRFVHQDLGLVPALGALDNLALGRGYSKGATGTISWREEAERGRRTLRQLGYDFNLKTPVSRLSASERTGIAIARALEDWSDTVKVLVLDEPTASLPAAEAERLFEVVRNVRDSGVAVIYVSHRFAEVLDLSDRITVLRDGVRVATTAASELDEGGLIELTIGRALKALEAAHEIPHQTRAGDPVLAVRGLSGRVVDGLDIDVHAGEIVGVAGVTGSGREEIADLVFGAAPRGGEVIVHGEPVPAERPDACVRREMALVPSERLSKAALRDMTLRENVTIGRIAPFYNLIGLSKRAERAAADEWLDKLDVVPRDSEARLITLSGGNQQKVMMARALRLEPRVLVLDEPTQGVDVGAKASIHEIVEEAAQGGAGVLVMSTESEELIGLCDRIVVLINGKALREFRPSELTADELTELTMREDLSVAGG